jgi:4-amino-4-deoxy-L-arabinose transferase-like glycosyltransferase
LGIGCGQIRGRGAQRRPREGHRKPSPRLADGTRYHRPAMRPLVTACVLAAGTWFLYASRVDTTPPALNDDEVVIALTAHSIATTGKDLRGRPWPLYIQMTEGSWYHPVIVYSIALVLQVLPLSEYAIRLTTVCVGVANVVLMYFLARVLFRREALAILAAMVLALTPTHFLHSRFALEFLYPLPFISIWLFCLFKHVERADARWLFASTFTLGLGFYSYLGSVFMTPVCLLLTVVTLVLHHRPLDWFTAARTVGIAVTGFAIPVAALFVPWLLTHQSAFDRTVGHYLIYDTNRLNPLQGVRELLSYSSIAARTSVYWGYVNPSFLFLDLTAPSTFSTRTTGVFLLPLALFVPVGLYRALRSAEPTGILLVLGFLTAPLAAVLVGEPGAINRALHLLPFGVLLAVVGVEYLWSGPRMPLRVVCLIASGTGLAVGIAYAGWTLATEGRISSSTPLVLLASLALVMVGAVSDRAAWRLVVVASLAAGLFQFQRYAFDYFTDYRSRVGEALLFNRGGGLEQLIERSRVEEIPAFYLSGLSRDVGVATEHWKFYLIKQRREDLLSRTVVLGETDPFDVGTVPAKSAILARAGDPTFGALVSAGELKLDAFIPEPSGRPVFAILRR